MHNTEVVKQQMDKCIEDIEHTVLHGNPKQGKVQEQRYSTIQSENTIDTTFFRQSVSSTKGS